MKVVSLLKGHDSPVLQVEVHPSEPILISCSDKELISWNLNTTEIIQRWSVSNILSLVTDCHQVPINIVRAGHLLIHQCSSLVLEREKSTDGMRKLETNIQTKLKLGVNSIELKLVWEEEVFIFSTHFPDCIRVADGLVFSKSIDGKIGVWDLKTFEPFTDFRIQSCHKVCSTFDVTPDGKYLACGNNDGFVFVYRIEDGKQLYKLHHKKCDSNVKCCAISPDKK